MYLFQFDLFLKILSWLKLGSCVCNHSWQHLHIIIIMECTSMGQVCHLRVMLKNNDNEVE